MLLSLDCVSYSSCRSERVGNELTEEQELMWEKLSTLPEDRKFDAGYFYCPYIPLIKKREALGLVTTDVC